MKNQEHFSISTAEYVFIAVSILLIPVLIGIFMLAVIAWRIGTRMENFQEHVFVGNIYEKTYKPEEYSIDVLENGK